MNVAEGQVQISKDVLIRASKTSSSQTLQEPTLFLSMTEPCSKLIKQLALFQLKDAVGELDFDNARDANFDGVYEFSVTYTVGSESVREDIALTVTDTATKTAAANTGTTNLDSSEAETFLLKFWC